MDIAREKEIKEQLAAVAKHLNAKITTACEGMRLLV